MERDTLEVLSSSSLDDSLTSIQWLCQLESNKLLEENRSQSLQNTHTQAAIEMRHRENTNKNPFPKPHYSYATLIVFAINSSKEKRMTLQEIYTWIETNYPFYKFAKKGWKNSIRHNLSLHKFFIKEKRPSVLHGKGSYWRISPEGKENLMRDLLKQSHNNLQPPYTLLPHDPNRKLRPIMPKPNGDMAPTKAVHYVPFVTCNYPILFVPSATGTSEGSAGTETSKPVSTTVTQPAESKTIASPSLQTTPVCSSFDSETNRCQSVRLSDITREKKQNESSKANRPPPRPAQHTKTKASGTQTPRTGDGLEQVANDRPKTRSPTNGAKLPNILRRKRKAQSRSPQSSAKLQSARRPSVSTPKTQPSRRSNTAAARIHTPGRPSMASAKTQLPVRASLQPTLAAINSGHHAAFSPKRNLNEFVGQNLNSSAELTSSPQNTSFDFLQYSFGSPGFSPLRSPARFGTGLTPLKDEADSGIMVTPMKVGFGDLGFNWTPLKTGFTPPLTSPPKSDTPSSQTCRKSLGLERIKDEILEPSISW